jgi:hypothetical protein
VNSVLAPAPSASQTFLIGITRLAAACSAGAEIPPRVEYSLTPRGKTLQPVIEALAKWGEGLELVRPSA